MRLLGEGVCLPDASGLGRARAEGVGAAKNFAWHASSLRFQKVAVENL